MRNWITGEPVTAFILAAGFGSLATAMGLREDWTPYLLAVFVVGLIVMTVSMWKYTAPVVLAALLAAPQLQAQAPFPDRQEQIQPAGVGVAVGVGCLCLGAYCVYKVASWCNKKFPPKDTNAVSNFAATGGQSGDEYGAAYNYAAAGSCWPGEYEFAPAGEDDGGTLWRLNILLESADVVRQTMTATSGPDQGFQTFEQFQAEMLSHGLWMSGVADGRQTFSWNRQPIDPSMSPISFDPETKTVRNTMAGEGERRRIVVSRSADLRNWSHFLSTEVGVGAGVQVVDATRKGQMFYRVEITQP